ncbi:hypothetical protein [Clostridium ihumii]|uniref:hypothetical protein n=1 Tax=Clostridium ihumii TaxID=1470356 RepID=UPI00058D10D0|nr:hypothetical protein [Clostridium ihumii]
MSRLANFECEANEDMYNRFQELKEQIIERKIELKIKQYNAEYKDLKNTLEMKKEELEDLKNEIESLEEDIEDIKEELIPLNETIEEYEGLKEELKHINYI